MFGYLQITVAAVVALAAMCSGCYEPVEITYPLYEIGDDVDETPYLGVWKCKCVFDEIDDYRIKVGTRLFLSPAENGRIQICFIDQNECSVATGRLTEIDTIVYFEIERIELAIGDNGSLVASRGAGASRARLATQQAAIEWPAPKVVAKAILKDGELFIATAHSLDEHVRDAVDCGELTGQRTNDALRVTATADELLAFLRERPSYPTWAVACYQRVDDFESASAGAAPNSTKLTASH